MRTLPVRMVLAVLVPVVGVVTVAEVAAAAIVAFGVGGVDAVIIAAAGAIYCWSQPFSCNSKAKTRNDPSSRCAQ